MSDLSVIPPIFEKKNGILNHPIVNGVPINCKKKLPVSRQNVTIFAKLEIDLSARPLNPPDPGILQC